MRHIAKAQDREGGVTLTELLVSIAVFGVVSASVTAASVSGLRQQTQVQDRNDALAQLRTALARIQREVRSTYPLLVASPTGIVLRVAEATMTRDITYAVSGAQLTVSETHTSSTGATTSVPTKVLLRNLVVPADQPVFRFAPKTGYVAPAGVGVNTATCVMPNGSIDTACVGTVTLRVSIQPSYLHAPVTMTDAGTDLRNAR